MKTFGEQHIRCAATPGLQAPSSPDRSDSRLVRKWLKQLGNTLFCVPCPVLEIVDSGRSHREFARIHTCKQVYATWAKKHKTGFHSLRSHAIYRCACYIGSYSHSKRAILVNCSRRKSSACYFCYQISRQSTREAACSAIDCSYCWPAVGERCDGGAASSQCSTELV